MKNSNYKVFYITLISFIIYFFVSASFEAFNLSWEPFDRINLVADFLKPKQKNTDSINLENENKSNSLSNNKDSLSSNKDFELYKKAQLITNFEIGNHSALPSFMEKLNRLKNGENVKIRIAYFGDSMIEADLLTQDLRALMQKEFGGYGVGFLPISSNVSQFRKSAKIVSSNWDDTNFMTKRARNMYLSGHYFTGDGTAFFMDNTIKNINIPIEKSLIYGYNGNSDVIYNGNLVPLNQSSLVNRQVLSNDNSNTITLSSDKANSLYYGVSFESEKGVFVDNFSFRGITGVELNKLSEDFLKSIQKANHYDLIVLQYGVNLVFRPDDTNYDYYKTLIKPAIKKLKNAFSDSEILLISSADRAFRYDGVYKTAIGLPNLIETQASLAFENNFAFYNQYATMGGENSIVRFADMDPPMANKDYIHPNHRGAEFLAKKLFVAFKNDYNKYTAAKK